MNEVTFFPTQPKPDPLANPDAICIELTEDQARPFAGLSEVFVIVGQGSYPNRVGKWCLYVQSVSKAQAHGASNVLAGTHRAVRNPVTAAPRAKVAPPLSAVP